MSGWKLSVNAPKAAVEAALERQAEAGDWDADLVLSGSESAPDAPDIWLLEVYLPRKPAARDRKAVAALFDGAVQLNADKLPDTDWVALSQQGAQPIRAGRFHVHTPDHAPLGEPGVTDFCIPAAQAFGTGQHETTAGCLAMLDAMRKTGVTARYVADIGTGTGLLAFAALDLWPRARAIASDIDPLCVEATIGNAKRNGVRLGDGPGALAVCEAAGTAHPALLARVPYDLLIANILAGPLIELAPDFARAVEPGGQLVLAGLLETQEAEVRRAYFRAGFRLARRMVRGDWSILWLRRRAAR